MFVINQLQNAQYVPAYTAAGDFMVDGYTFEIGGKSKGQKQINKVKKSFLVLDDIIIADKNKIPLYLFGFLKNV